MTIVRTGGLGDTILVLPTVDILRTAHPDAAFTLVGSAWAEALQPLLPFAARVLHVDRVFPPARRGRHENKPGGDVFATSSAVIVYTAAPEGDFVLHVRRTCPGSVLVWPVTPAAGTHAARHLATVVVAAMPVRDALPAPVLQCPPALRPESRAWLTRQLGHRVRPVAVHPGSGGRRKCWPARRFADLARCLDAPVLLVEGPADADVCREFSELVAPSVQVARAADLPLSRLSALLVECRGYIGNDSGVSHLAAALGIPTIAVFGPTDPTVWAPLGPEVSVVAPRADAVWPSIDEVLTEARRWTGDGAGGSPRVRNPRVAGAGVRRA